jgi:predicted nucleic acid-binding Zn ribbon protein
MKGQLKRERENEQMKGILERERRRRRRRRKRLWWVFSLFSIIGFSAFFLVTSFSSMESFQPNLFKIKRSL